MRCPNCATELPGTAKFCLECGLPLGGPADHGGLGGPDAYTPKHLAEKILTSRAAIEGERKQVTVVFCDLANSTPLAERLGPEGMHAFLNRFFELALSVAHRYEGTINQFLGDGFMALFGAPLAHEDDARRAVLAALDIRRALRDRASYVAPGAGSDLAVRIGVNTGPVVVGSIGDNLRMDYTAIGDTTNVAARLQQVAEPGAILISEPTARLVRTDVRLLPVGPLPLKGKSDPVVAYRVLGPAPRTSSFDVASGRAFSRFVGREGELQVLLDSFSDAERGRHRVVSVVGEAGIGKSRLLHEFRRRLDGRPHTSLEGRCRAHGSGVPYLPLLDILRHHCAITDTDAPPVVAQKVRLALLEVGIDPDDRGPYLLELLGMKDSRNPLAGVGPEVVRSRTADTLNRMLRESSRARTLVLLVEDLQWIDTSSEQDVASLVSSLGDARILLVTTTRPGYAPPWMRGTGTTQLTLGPLPSADSLSLLRSIGSVADTAVPMILARADGNPLFLEELARTVCQREADTPFVVPDTLQGVLMARIDRLPEASKRLLQTAAVLGREFSLTLLEKVWDGPGPAATHLHVLARADLVHQQTNADEPAYVVNQTLTHEMAYTSLLSGHRRALHERAGRALESLYSDRLEQIYDRLALHFTRADNIEKAIEYLTRLAERATRSYAIAQATGALDEALALADRLPPGAPSDRLHIDLVLRKSEALVLGGDLQGCLELLLGTRDRVEGLNEPSHSGPYYCRLALTYGVLGESQRERELARRAIEDADRCGDRATLGKAHFILGRASFWSADLQAGVEHNLKAIAFLESADDRSWVSQAHWSLGLCYEMLGEFDRALEVETTARAIGEKLGDPRLVSMPSWVIGVVQVVRGEEAAGISACEQSLELAPDPISRAASIGFLGYAYLELGDHERALPLLEEAAAAFKGFTFPQLEGWFTVFLAHANLLKGDPVVARELVRRGVEIARTTAFVIAAATAERLLGLIAQAEGDLAGADAHLTRALADFESISTRFEVARTRLALAELAQSRGDQAALASHAAEAYRSFAALRVPLYAERVAGLAAASGIQLAEGSPVRLPVA